MDERKNKMTDQRYREILPMAYMTAAIEKGRQPRPVEVGLCARAIVDAEDENNLAYRVAMATKIHCTIFDFFDGVDIRVIEDDGIFVDVDFGRSSIVVENGRWYVSNFD